MFAAIGDVYTDEAPLQVTQFESDIRIAEQLRQLFFEGGGGNDFKRYLTFELAKEKIKTDAVEKHGKKVYLHYGDDGVDPKLNQALSRFLEYLNQWV